MFYTITTRTRNHGIYFEPHELEPLGITEDSTCWGIWVEGRAIDQRARFDGKERWLQNETPHLAVSPIHPTLWPTAFNLHVLLQRRPFEKGEPPECCDAVLGLTDALARCGINILCVQTAQLGYDLISFLATCELPRLRKAAKHFWEKADAQGRKMEAERARLEREKTPDEEVKRKLAEMEQSVIEGRVDAFRNLGCMVMPRLAELEGRLLLIDNYRFRYWQSKHGTKASRKVKEEIEGEYIDEEKYILIVGAPPKPGMTASQRQEEFTEALSASWFLNSKIVEAGENSYFLAYQSILDRDAIRKARSPDLDPAELIDMPGELGKATLDALYQTVLDVLHKRELRSDFESLIPKFPVVGASPTELRARSATAERTEKIKRPEDLERKANRDFFRRQALMPVTVSALPSLAYARFWAFAGAEGRGKPVALRYRNKLLRPDCAESDSAARMSSTVALLNSLTRVRQQEELEASDIAAVLKDMNASEGGAAKHAAIVTERLNALIAKKAGDKRGPFGPHMAVYGNVDLHNRLLRLRFARFDAEIESYVTVRLRYRTDGLRDVGPNSQGLMRDAIALIVAKGFKVERASNKITHSDPETEVGWVEINAKAINQDGLRACSALASDNQNTDGGRFRSELVALLDRVCWVPAKAARENFDKRGDDVVITLGLVSEDR